MLKANTVKTATTDALRSASDLIRREVMRREEAQNVEAHRAMVGKCFRYRNCYSCPEKPSDYWWLYAKAERLGEMGYPVGVSFQVDKDGVLTIQPQQRLHVIGAWQEIPASDFDAEFAKVLANMKALQSSKSQRISKSRRRGSSPRRK